MTKLEKMICAAVLAHIQEVLDPWESQYVNVRIEREAVFGLHKAIMIIIPPSCSLAEKIERAVKSKWMHDYPWCVSMRR